MMTRPKARSSKKTEQKLIQRILKGEKGAKQQFYKQYFPKISNYIFGKIDNPLDAQEVVQDVFIAAIDCLPTFNFQSSVSTWIYAITKHEIADYYRKKKIKTVLFSHLPILETLATSALGPEEEMIEQEIKTQIRVVLAYLSEGYQRILRLKYIQGHSVAQIAVILRISPKATESKLSRARLAFREVWTTESEKVKAKSEKLPGKTQKNTFL